MTRGIWGQSSQTQWIQMVATATIPGMHPPIMRRFKTAKK